MHNVNRVFNFVLHGREGLWSLDIKEGRISSITPWQPDSNTSSDLVEQAGTINANGGMLLPPFVEPHVHLDSTQTAGQPEWNRSGTLFEGIERWAQRKPMLTHNDVKQRAMQTIKWQIAHGVQYIRSHVDVSDHSLVALKAMLELREEISNWVDLQIVAFPQEGILSFDGGPELMEEAMRLGADVVGGIPHFEFTRELGVQSMHDAFNLALKYDKPIDIHCDETDDEQSRFLETVAMLAHTNGLGSRVTASHTTAMHSYNGAYTSRLMRLLKLSNINFIANPLINIHLQGRFDTYPKRRGMTRVPELLKAGLNVCFGHDDVFDPWYPLGIGKPLQVLHMGMHITQMMGFDQLNNGLALITDNSAKALGITNYGIEQGKPARFIILPAENGFEAIRRQVDTLYSVRDGKVIASTKPSNSNIFLNGQAEQISFRRS